MIIKPLQAQQLLIKTKTDGLYCLTIGYLTKITISDNRDLECF